jgi:hypothetical protein
MGRLRHLRLQTSSAATLLLLGSVPLLAAEIEPDAERILRQMSDHLSSRSRSSPTPRLRSSCATARRFSSRRRAQVCSNRSATSASPARAPSPISSSPSTARTSCSMRASSRDTTRWRWRAATTRRSTRCATLSASRRPVASTFPTRIPMRGCSTMSRAASITARPLWAASPASPDERQGGSSGARRSMSRPSRGAALASQSAVPATTSAAEHITSRMEAGMSWSTSTRAE